GNFSLPIEGEGWGEGLYSLWGGLGRGSFFDGQYYFSHHICDNKSCFFPIFAQPLKQKRN
ncbi:MAG: hypothetical protein IKQ72_12375, partial [Bacteroidaceae bacterium]|nr:hypothetical protein [Bacteroidaceae bacterium]